MSHREGSFSTVRTGAPSGATRIHFGTSFQIAGWDKRAGDTCFATPFRFPIFLQDPLPGFDTSSGPYAPTGFSPLSAPDFFILPARLLHSAPGTQSGRTSRRASFPDGFHRFSSRPIRHDSDLTRLGFGTTRIATALTSSSPRPSLARIGFHRPSPAGTIRLAGLSVFSVLVPSSAMSRTSAFHGNGSLRPTSSVCAGGTWLRCSACPPRTPPIPWGGIP